MNEIEYDDKLSEIDVLDEISSIKCEPPRITIYGKPSIGKTTLANQLPDPCFLLTEKPGITSIKKAFPVAVSYDELWFRVSKLLKKEVLPFKTLVIDSVSKLDHLIVDYVLKTSPDCKGGNRPKTLGEAYGGYGNGFEKARLAHRAFKDLCDKFTQRDIGVIYIAHLTVCKYKAPDTEDYDMYNIEMQSDDKSRAPYINDVDGVFFCKNVSFVHKSKDPGFNARAKVASTDTKVIVTGVSDVNVSKNRFQMPNEIKMSFEEIKKYIPYYNQGQNEEVPNIKFTASIEAPLNQINAIM